jgi:hypothetical protein
MAISASFTCRTSDPRDSPSWNLLDGGGRNRAIPDIDGDRREELLELKHDKVVITLSVNRREVEATSYNSWEDEKYSLVSAIPVPAELIGTSVQVVAARRAVEDALFHTICEAPDASLAWLLEKEHTLRWAPDPFQMPGWYTFYSAERRHVVKAQSLWTGPFPAQAVWFTYRGRHHRHDRLELSRELEQPRVLAERGAFALLGTAHGVILADRAHNRHAWLYIQMGGVKMIFTTVSAARFDGRRAIVDIELRQMEEAGRAWIDLDTGRVKTKFWNAL